jgi:hypothetical protein
MVVVMTVVVVIVIVIVVVVMVVMVVVMVVIVVVVELAGHDYSLTIGRSLCLRGYDGSSLQTRATARPVYSRLTLRSPLITEGVTRQMLSLVGVAVRKQPGTQRIYPQF